MKTIVLFFALASVSSAKEKLYCNANALSAAERERYQEVAGKLFAAATGKDELKNGYAFHFTVKELALAAEFVDFESRCCPFFGFELQLQRDRGPLVLRITGPDGVKEFIRAELGH
jgi:hypothetical protein